MKNKAISFVTKLMLKIKCQFKQTLPVMNGEHFDKYCDMIFTAYGLPNNDSFRHAIAVQIMNLGPQIDVIAPKFFKKSVKKAMANEIAFHKIQAYKEEERKIKREFIAKQKEEADLAALQDEISQPTITVNA